MRIRKIVIIVLVISVSIFVYSQYVLVSQIGMNITRNQLLEENQKGLTYDIELEFNNPSLLILTAGETEFFITSNDEIIGKGKLEPFVLSPLNKNLVNGTYLKDPNKDSQDNTIVKISGVTKYNVFFTSFEVPFVFYPTPAQAREFIHQN